MKVKNIMSEPITVHKSDTISHAMELMDKNDTRRLLVLNGNESVGIITMRSIANKLGTWKTSNLPASSLHVAAATTDAFTRVLPDMGIELSLIHISEPTRLRRISYAVFCLKKKKKN